MKQIQQQLSLAVFIYAILCMNGCVPVFSDLQSARTVPKGKVQITPSFSSVSVTDAGETEKVQNVFVGQLAIGVHESSEFRLAFARVDFPEGRRKAWGGGGMRLDPCWTAFEYPDFRQPARAKSL